MSFGNRSKWPLVTLDRVISGVSEVWIGQVFLSLGKVPGLTTNSISSCFPSFVS